MKTNLWIKTTALLILSFLGIYSAALAMTLSKPNHVITERAPVEMADSRSDEQALLRNIRAIIGYPSFLSAKAEGAHAKVSFTISEEGVIEVITVDAESEQLSGYIIEKLSGKRLPGFDWAYGHTFHLALNFHFVQ